MNFYDNMQLSVKDCKELIRKAETPELKRKYWLALIAKDISCVAFAVLFIAGLNMIFGEANSCAAVVIFCALLSVRFVDFGYCLSSSLVNLGIIFTMMAAAPWISGLLGPWGGLLVNLVCIGYILLAACSQPIMGNAGLYVFGYIFMYGQPVEGHELVLRICEMAVGFILCGTVYFIKHRKKIYKLRFRDVLPKKGILLPVGRWQIKLATGVSIALLIGQLTGLPRLMWMGFAALSVISPYENNLKVRAAKRAGGVVIGSAAFLLLYGMAPESLRTIFGILGGLCLGLCADYAWSTIFNCFGALCIAAVLFGLPQAAGLRILMNLSGIVFICLYHVIFEWLCKRAVEILNEKKVSCVE